MIKSPLSEDLGSSPCLALIATRVPMAGAGLMRCEVCDLCLSVQVTLRQTTRNPHDVHARCGMGFVLFRLQQKIRLWRFARASP